MVGKEEKVSLVERLAKVIDTISGTDKQPSASADQSLKCQSRRRIGSYAFQPTFLNGHSVPVVLVDMLGPTLVIPFLPTSSRTWHPQRELLTPAPGTLVGIVIATYSGPVHFDANLGVNLGSHRQEARSDVRPGRKLLFFIVFGLSGSLAMAIIARFGWGWERQHRRRQGVHRGYQRG